MSTGEATGVPAAAAGSTDDEDRILTVPNLISLIRLGCLPIFVWLMFGRHNRAAAAGLLAGLGCTDWIDGYIARHFHQVSKLGKVLDPVADRLLFFVGVGCILGAGCCSTWFAVAVLAREGLVAGATLGLAAAGARRIDVTWFGKAGTFGLMIAFPLFLTSHSTMGWHRTAGDLAWLAAVPGIIFSYTAMAMYVPLGLKALREGRADRAGSATDPG